MPHLSRDMLMSYLSRDDYFSSHTANMQRGLLNEGKECQYIYDFLDEWLKQEQYNDVVYFNNYTGAGWLNDGRNYGAPAEVSRDLYRQCLQYYREKADEGSLQVVTMSEYAKIHAASYTFGKGEVNFWRDLACNSGRELIWYVDSFWRIALDPNCGGSLVDLRPYVGRVTQDLGPNSAQMWNGSYPFALNMLHRGAGLTASIGSTSLFGTRMHTDKVERTPDGAVRVSLKQIDLENEQGNITVSAEYDFYPDGRILLKKKLLAADDPDAIIPICETFKGTHGRTEYPEDIGNAVLSMQDNVLVRLEFRIPAELTADAIIRLAFTENRLLHVHFHLLKAFTEPAFRIAKAPDLAVIQNIVQLVLLRQVVDLGRDGGFYIRHFFLLSRFIDGVALDQMPRKLAQAQAAFAQTCQQLCGDGLQDGFCIFVAACIFFAERITASARLFQSRQQGFLRAFQHCQRIKHRRRAHLAAGQEDTAPASRHRRHWGHCCQLTFRGHFRLHLQLQPEHRFCLFHVRSFF